jgi:AhpD family alkylhydroperoxidase
MVTTRKQKQFYEIIKTEKSMELRIDMEQLEPLGYKSLYPLEKYLTTTKLTQRHKDLIKVRASQVNGCAFCINRHTREARAHGESEKRIYLLNAWKDTTLFTPEERAILALTEEVTLISNHVSEITYRNAAALFDEHYLAQIVFCIIAINAWNRIAITTQIQPEE